MTDNQRSRFNLALGYFPEGQGREYVVISFDNETSPRCSTEHTDDLAQARRAVMAVEQGGAQAEIYRFDGTHVWCFVGDTVKK